LEIRGMKDMELIIYYNFAGQTEDRVEEGSG
jgi:hypothetical protein